MLFALMTVGLLPLGLAQSVPALVGLMAVAGLAVAPFVAAEFRLIDQVSPKGTAVEALTWIVTTYAVGMAAGSLAAGVVAEQASARAALMAAAASCGIGFLVALLRRRTLVTTRPVGNPSLATETS